MSLNLSCLQGVVPVTPKVAPRESAKVKQISNGFVVYKSGKIVYSKEFVGFAGLGEQKGIDIFLSTEWSQIQVLDKIVFVSFSDKGQAKMDLLGSTKQGGLQAKGDVFFTNKSKKGLKLYNYLAEVFPEADNYHVDIVLEYQMKTDNDLYYIPKFHEKGDDAGKPATPVKREFCAVYPLDLVPLEVNDTLEGEIIEAVMQGAPEEKSFDTPMPSEASNGKRPNVEIKEEAPVLTKEGRTPNFNAPKKTGPIVIEHGTSGEPDLDMADAEEAKLAEQDDKAEEEHDVDPTADVFDPATGTFVSANKASEKSDWATSLGNTKGLI
ncbi:MAG: hypothetical protein KAH32_02920 [Chlamydiia bacterium]|nr:hypothetical protein [Chlamydiia bacterium]